jgi:hypothetical protein
VLEDSEPSDDQAKLPSIIDDLMAIDDLMTQAERGGFDLDALLDKWEAAKKQGKVERVQQWVKRFNELFNANAKNSQNQGDRAGGICMLVTGVLIFFSIVCWFVRGGAAWRAPEPQPAPEPQHVPESKGIMNRKQKKCLWVGIAVFILMGLFPPWYSYSSIRGYNSLIYHSYGYGFLLIPPEGRSIDTHRLYVQWSMVGVVTGGLILTFGDRKAVKPPDSLGS